MIFKCEYCSSFEVDCTCGPAIAEINKLKLRISKMKDLITHWRTDEDVGGNGEYYWRMCADELEIVLEEKL